MVPVSYEAIHEEIETTDLVSENKENFFIGFKDKYFFRSKSEANNEYTWKEYVY